MSDALLSFLGKDWAGLAIALAVAAIGGLLLRAARPAGRWRRGLGLAILAFAALLAFGALWHWLQTARALARHPPPGQLADLGGYRLHLLAEGEANGRPAVIWLPGGHGAGFYLHHLHRQLRDEARSILIDRPGTGWSDLGPLPRSTAREAEELVAALERIGEPGPFVLAGHSFGGLLAANMARRHPNLVAGLVLLDATPPDSIVYAPYNPILAQMRRDAALGALANLFGLSPALRERLWGGEQNPEAQRITRLMEQQLGSEALAAVRAAESGTRAQIAAASIYAELSPEGMARAGWETVVYDGDLGDLPLYLVAPGDMLEFEDFSKTLEEASRAQGGEALAASRVQRFYREARERYMRASSRAQRIVAPPGTGHNFPYEAPEFVVDLVRRVLRETAPAPAAEAPSRPDGG